MVSHGSLKKKKKEPFSSVVNFTRFLVGILQHSANFHLDNLSTEKLYKQLFSGGSNNMSTLRSLLNMVIIKEVVGKLNAMTIY